MDLTRDILFRNFLLNDSAISANVLQGGGVGKGIAGSVIDSVSMEDVDIVQFTQKRSQSDGMDAGDVFLGMKRIRMAGTLYDLSRGLLNDRLQLLRATMSPVLAQREEPGDKGYRPLYFSVPTNDTANYPSGTKDLRALCMPRGLATTIQRDQQGGTDEDALAQTYQATFVLKDPTVQGEVPIDVPFTPTTNVSTTVLNRGDYLAPLNMLFVTTSHAGVITVAAGDSLFVITLPTSTGTRTVRFKGEDKVLTVEEEGIESLRRSYLAFTNNTGWPLIPGGSSPFSVTFSGGLALSGAAGDSHAWFWERFA